MANTYFQFKQFRIDQEQCAMKVCTDGCLQGAYAIAWLKKEWAHKGKCSQKILDIGTGTGLLSLMLAQELPWAVIDTVELDNGAYLQANKNVARSSWPGRIHIFHGDIRRHDAGGKYDFIICNPPFYDNDLKSKDDAINQAKHGITLNYDDLIEAVQKYLLPSGAVCIMLPPRQFAILEQIAVPTNLYAAQMMQVRHSPHSDIFRIIGILKREKTGPKKEEICIRAGNGQYTAAFTTLLKEFYLQF